MNRIPMRVTSHDKVTSRNDGRFAMKGTSLSSCACPTKLSTTTDLNKLRWSEPSLLDKDQWFDDEFPPSDGMAPAAGEEDDTDHRASIFASNAPLGIKSQSIANETTLNNYPSLSCNPSFEGFEVVDPNGEKAHTMTKPQRSVDSMHTLMGRTKSIHRAVRMGVARIRRTHDCPVEDSAVLDSTCNLLCREDEDQDGNIETSKNEVGRFELSTKKDLCQGDEDSQGDVGRCLIDTPTVVRKFPPSTEIVTATSNDDGDHRMSIERSKATPGIENQSFDQDMASNNLPALGCGTSFEGYEVMHPSEEKAHTMTSEQKSFDTMQSLKPNALKKKKSIHRVVKVGVARIRRTRERPVNGIAVGDSVSNLQPLEDKDQAGDIETSTAKDLKDLGQFEPFSTLELDQCHGDEDGCLMDNPTDIFEFLPSTEMATATTDDDDGDHRVSIERSKATPGIENQSFDQDMASNNLPALGCGTSFEGYEVMHPSEEKAHTMTSEQKSFDTMQSLKPNALKKKKSIHRVVKVGVARIRRTRERPVNGIAVGDSVSNLQPLEDKDQAGDIETSTAKDLKDLGQFEPFSTLELDQCHGDEDGCLMDNSNDIYEFLPSTEMPTAVTKDDDGDRCVSIDGSKATPGIESQSFEKDMASNYHPDVHCSSSFEEFEALNSSLEKTHPMTTRLSLLEAMQPLKSSALRKKKSTHRAVRVEVAKTHDKSVGDRVSNLQYLEDKDRAGTETILNDLGQFKTQSLLNKDDFQCKHDGCSTDSPTRVDRFPSFVAMAAATSAEEDDNHLVSIMTDQNCSPLLVNDQCQGIDDRCSMDSPFGDDGLLSSAGMAAATDKDHVGVHCVSTPMDLNDLGQFEQPSLDIDQCLVSELVDVRSRSTVSVDSTGKSLSKVLGSKMTKVKETQPLSGPMCCIMTNAKKGQAKIAHEATPATGREGFKLVVEEKGYETIECDLLPGREEGSPDVNTTPLSDRPAFCYGPSFEGFEVMHPPLQKSHPMTPRRSLEGNQSLKSHATTFGQFDENSVNHKSPSSLLQDKAHSCNYGHKLESAYTKSSALSWYPAGSMLRSESIDGPTPVERLPSSAGIYNVSSAENSSMEFSFLESFEVDSTVLPDDTSFECVPVRSLFGGDFPNFHDVVDRIDDAITGCMGSSLNLSDDESDDDPFHDFSDEEDNVEVRLRSGIHKKRTGQKNSQIYGCSGGRIGRASYKVNFSPSTIASKGLMVPEDSFDNVLRLPS